jgi:hypothetical protein
VWERSKQRHPGRLHGLVNDRQELGGEGIQVDLVAPAGGERLDGLCGVVFASVEAAIHRGLDTPPSRAKDRRRGQRCPIRVHKCEAGGSRINPSGPMVG